MDLLIWAVVLALGVLMIYTMLTEKRTSVGHSAKEACCAHHAPAAPAEQAEAEVAVAEEVVVEEESAEESTAAETEGEALGERLRNPDTGEVVAVPSNYRFAKRWIKDALVTEGLLDRVYANNELDDEASERVKAAVLELRRLEKYRA